MTCTQWKIAESDSTLVKKIVQKLGCSPVLASVLVNRNIKDEEDAVRFFKTSLSDIRPPFSIKDMDVAVKRIYSAIIGKQKILIFGDYDADGVTATTILIEFLREAGADVGYYIPHRVKEGYGLHTEHIRDFAMPRNIDLIITVDCGISSHDAVKLAQESGIDVIVTDHHQVSDTLPPAAAVINPKRTECFAGFEHLAGVGVAFYLVIYLRAYLRDMNFWSNRPEPNLRRYCDLVALGTVADIVPLVGENRILCKIGIDVMRSGARIGINELVGASGVQLNSVDAETIAFRLAPRVNASGRIDHAKMAVELLTSTDPDEAKDLAQTLNKLNTQRQAVEKVMFDEILESIAARPEVLRDHSLVMAHPEWHEGILGIVASRLVENFFRPVILISTRNGMGKGSGRSIPGINLYHRLTDCASELETFGGHAMAAGVRIRKDRIERFREEFERAITDTSLPDIFFPTISIDYELNFPDITDRLVDELESLEPFGEGNEEPLFMAKNVHVVTSSVVGTYHRRMVLSQPSSLSGRLFNAIHFNINPEQLAPLKFDRLAFRLRWNRFNNRKSIQLIVKEV